MFPCLRFVLLCQFAGILWLTASLPAQATTDISLTDLFVQAKTQFKAGAYETSLATLQRLDEASRAPGSDAAREKLEPAIAFYRGVNLAALGKSDEAAAQFKMYLAFPSPATRLDPSMYPRSVVDLYAQVRAESRGPAALPDAGLAEESARFRTSRDRPAVPIDERWANGAIRFLMTKSEKAHWKRISDPVARAEFVSEFWQRRDPTPEAPENEYREEIERRVQFADGRFAQGETKGSETDRGMVFVLMGPPSYVGQQPIKAEEDPIQAARAAPVQEFVANPDGSTSTRMVSREPLTAQRLQGTREVWHYRRDRLPPAVGFAEVDFEFLTKPGLGVAVLQREPDVLTALELAARAGRAETSAP
jgi:GWxTD domain-containing protein